MHDHPSTKMLALAFLVMVGMALMADGLHFHIERAFIYTAMLFSGAVEALNLWRGKNARRRRAARAARSRREPSGASHESMRGLGTRSL